MPLYHSSASPTLSAAAFAEPGPEYRGAPFWSWNCKLDRAKLHGWAYEYQLRPYGILAAPVLEQGV